MDYSEQLSLLPLESTSPIFYVTDMTEIDTVAKLAEKERYDLRGIATKVSLVSFADDDECPAGQTLKIRDMVKNNASMTFIDGKYEDGVWTKPLDNELLKKVGRLVMDKASSMTLLASVAAAAFSTYLF